jgi:hypothetical protein
VKSFLNSILYSVSIKNTARQGKAQQGTMIPGNTERERGGERRAADDGSREQEPKGRITFFSRSDLYISPCRVHVP